MQMTVGQKQRFFAKHAARLILKAYELGYEVSLGHAFRCIDCHIGRKYSLHKQKLAIDLNLFKDGEYLASTEDHRELGEWWEDQHPDFSWGGRFSDGNHYSMKHGGRR